MKINIVDAGCGVGKTTALINKINEDNSDQKYLFITPFLTEVERIKKNCPNKNFIDPQIINKGSKLNNIISLFKNGENIVTTHALFKRLDIEIIKTIKEQHYVLIMDEVSETIEELQISKSDLKTLVEKYVSINPKTHMVQWHDSEYSGKFNEYMKLIKTNNVFAYTNEKDEIVCLLWMFPYQIFESFDKVFILTYMFDGQIQKIYFDYFNAEYILWYIKDFHLTPTPQIYNYNKEKQLIKIYHGSKLNKIGENKTALSKTWFDKNKKTYKIKELQNNMHNFFRTQTKSAKNEILWTTFKEYKGLIKKKGFISGFAPINSRATNDYMNRTAVAYIGNRYLKPTIKNFFTINYTAIPQEFEDKFALSEMIQFIYRSAIRKGEPIDIYIPSKRMRELLENWIKKKND